MICRWLSAKSAGQYNREFAQQPYEPSDGFFAVRTIWLSNGMNFEPVHLLSLLCMYLVHNTVVATFTVGEPQFSLEISIPR